MSEGGLLMLAAGAMLAGAAARRTRRSSATAPAAARPSSAPADGENARVVDTVARTIWGEARSETRRGKHAVACVIVNRAKDERRRWPRTLDGVCLQPWQFSCWNRDDPNRAKLLAVTEGDAAFRECLEIARAAVRGALQDITFGANHYYAPAGMVPPGSKPRWADAPGMAMTTRIGGHIFFRN